MVRVDERSAGKLHISRLLQTGVYVEEPSHQSVTAFACGLLGISAQRFKAQARTVILNNRVVDDPDQTPVNGGDTLVLSGAMPGLVGSMLRSDSPYKAMRETITGSSGAQTGRSGYIRVKLFNTVLAQHRRAMVGHGFWIDGE